MSELHNVTYPFVSSSSRYASEGESFSLWYYCNFTNKFPEAVHHYTNDEKHELTQEFLAVPFLQGKTPIYSKTTISGEFSIYAVDATTFVVVDISNTPHLELAGMPFASSGPAKLSLGGEEEWSADVTVIGRREQVKELTKLLDPFYKEKEKVSKNKISIICRNSGGFYLENFKPKKTVVDLKKNYAPAMQDVHNHIVSSLQQEDATGLVLLHGKPGTGKTTYIRHLATHLKKQVIYLPPGLSHTIADPAMIPFLMEERDSVLLIEDAEEILRVRGDGVPGVANLLNLTDGLLGDCLKMSAICTFNADIGEIDPALLREGRLVAQYEFEPLCKEQAQELLNHLGKDHKATSEMTLAEIYKIGEGHKVSRAVAKTIGFV